MYDFSWKFYTDWTVNSETSVPPYVRNRHRREKKKSATTSARAHTAHTQTHTRCMYEYLYFSVQPWKRSTVCMQSASAVWLLWMYCSRFLCNGYGLSYGAQGGAAVVFNIDYLVNSDICAARFKTTTIIIITEKLIRKRELHIFRGIDLLMVLPWLPCG